jgi:hypothetical protein
MQHTGLYASFSTDDSKKDLFVTRFLSPAQERSLFWCKAIGAFLLFLSAVVSVFLVLTATQFTRFLTITTDFRNGAPLQADRYPAIVEANVSSNGIDVGLTAAFVSILGWLGLTFNALFNNAEIEQLNQGSDPYFWLFTMLWLPVAIIVWAVVAGIHNPFLIGALALLAWAYNAQWWADDLLHSNAYVYALSLYTRWQGAEPASWSWVTYVQGLFLMLSIFVIIFVYLGFTFGGAVAPAGILLLIALAGPIFYIILGPAIIVPVYRGGWISMIYTRTLYLYIHAFLTIIIVTWLTLIVYAANPTA